MAEDQQRLAFDPPAEGKPRVSRPLRTGQSFVLVVPSRRVFTRRWDKAHYEPGEECRMSIHGKRLGRDPLSVTVESENEDGTWSVVAKVQAEVGEGEDHAVVTWRFPEKPAASEEPEAPGEPAAD